jgi:pimeloyl-ACP methyl ester carboxylesterase
LLRAFALLFAAGVSLAHAQPSDTIVKVARDGYSISALVTQLPEAKVFRHVIALFPGYPGIMKLTEEGGQSRYELRGNFLVRSRRDWLDDETVVVVVDAPSDQWATFNQTFRERPRYGADVRALLEEVSRRYAVMDFTFVGTSEGSVSAFHAARMNPQLARRLILTSSVFLATHNGPALSDVDWKALSSRLLWVHHAEDPCKYTAYHHARRFAQATHSPLVTVRGGEPGSGDACQAFTAHGFVGIERETVLAMRSWVKSGATPPDVAR